jgi:hypothetical protein
MHTLTRVIPYQAILLLRSMHCSAQVAKSKEPRVHVLGLGSIGTLLHTLYLNSPTFLLSPFSATAYPSSMPTAITETKFF